jgi:hypothetical protein
LIFDIDYQPKGSDLLSWSAASAAMAAPSFA